MSRSLPSLSKLLSPWASAGPYLSRVSSPSASNDALYDLRELPHAANQSARRAGRPAIRQGVLLSSPNDELRYIDGSILVRRRDH